MPTLYNIFPKTQDERIRDDVRRQLMWQTDIQPEGIVVELNDSAVVLSGRVETCLERREAERAASAVHGASSITNAIQVEPKRTRTNREIADDVRAGLRMAICILEELLSASVSDGVVTLRGRVRWKFQAMAAERAGDAVAGVLRVRNLIEVAPFGDFQSMPADQSQTIG
jgi:osmotically-inducible protein OsmY